MIFGFRLPAPRMLGTAAAVLVGIGALCLVLVGSGLTGPGAGAAGGGGPAGGAAGSGTPALGITGHPEAAARAAAAAAGPAQPSGPPPALIATLTADTAYSTEPGGPAVGTLAADNPFGAPNVVAVLGGSGHGDQAWLHVELPVRPNGSTGWVRAAEVTLTQTDYAVAVSLAARTLTVTRAGRVVLSTPVAVGKASTPTPPAHTYLWELIRPDDPNGVYGPFVFGVAEYSDSYAVFNGGDAQIGIHGQDEPWSIGYAVSNGCVRVPNDTISQLAGMLPLGTPVTIS